MPNMTVQDLWKALNDIPQVDREKLNALVASDYDTMGIEFVNIDREGHNETGPITAVVLMIATDLPDDPDPFLDRRDT